MLAILCKYLILISYVHLHPVLPIHLKDAQGKGSCLFHQTCLFPGSVFSILPDTLPRILQSTWGAEKCPLVSANTCGKFLYLLRFLALKSCSPRLKIHYLSQNLISLSLKLWNDSRDKLVALFSWWRGGGGRGHWITVNDSTRSPEHVWFLPGSYAYLGSAFH